MGDRPGHEFHGNQWTGGGGGTLYHGTTAAVVERIKAEGLRAGDAGRVWHQSVRGGRGAVYVTSDAGDARKWAAAAARSHLPPGWSPGQSVGATAVIEIRVPTSEAHRFQVDRQGMKDLGPGVRREGVQRLMTRGDIPPEWIHRVEVFQSGEFRPTSMPGDFRLEGSTR